MHSTCEVQGLQAPGLSQHGSEISYLRCEELGRFPEKLVTSLACTKTQYLQMCRPPPEPKSSSSNSGKRSRTPSSAPLHGRSSSRGSASSSGAGATRRLPEALGAEGGMMAL